MNSRYSEIRLYRLTSGEDVIGTPQESDIAGSVAIKWRKQNWIGVYYD